MDFESTESQLVNEVANQLTVPIEVVTSQRSDPPTVTHEVISIGSSILGNVPLNSDPAINNISYAFHGAKIDAIKQRVKDVLVTINRLL